MRLPAALALAAALAACAEPYQPATPQEAAAMAQCHANGLAAVAGVLDPVAATVGRMRYEAACHQAWLLSQASAPYPGQAAAR